MKKALPIITAVLLLLYMAYGIFFMTDSHEEVRVCNGIDLAVHDSLKSDMVTHAMVMDMLREKGIDPTGKTLDVALLDSMESVLCMHPFIERAQCYKTAGDLVKIEISTKVPLVRVRNWRGQDFYVDSHGSILPCRSIAVHVPVATGYIDRNFASNQLLSVIQAINADDFWKAQIEQMNVTQNGFIELVPRVGHHLLEIGSADNVSGKLDRLMNFYKKGLDEIGWNKYSVISVAYDGQVVCRKRK